VANDSTLLLFLNGNIFCIYLFLFSAKESYAETNDLHHLDALAPQLVIREWKRISRSVNYFQERDPHVRDRERVFLLGACIVVSSAVRPRVQLLLLSYSVPFAVWMVADRQREEEQRRRHANARANQ
jgi:hypothetical protein